MKRSLRLVLSMAVACAAGCALIPTAAQAAFTPCKKGSKILCGTVPVPLDRAGAVPGTVKLRVAKVPARRGPAAGTLLLLAGGPGQGGLKAINPALIKALPNYDIVAFDQRGTGLSGALRCKALKRGTSAKAVAKCAQELGPRRGYYRSYDTVQDIEAVRIALGAPKLTLFSVSYGGRVAGEYVRRYPGSVAKQVMDSPTPITGTDPFSRQFNTALPRVLNGLAPGTVARLQAVVTRLRKKPVRATVFTSRGRAKRIKIAAPTLYGLLRNLDLDPQARGQVPAALTAFTNRDAAPLARLLAGSGGVGEEVGKNFYPALFLATSCSEAPLPWDTAVAPSKARIQSAASAVKALGAAPFAPFGADIVIDGSELIPDCLAWPAVPKAPAIPVPPAPVAVTPQASVPPAQTQPSPGAPTAAPVVPGATTGPQYEDSARASQASGKSPVPTLILEGAEDTRTPAETSQATAATYSSVTNLDVPFTGHSTLGADASKCALRNTVLFLTTGGGVGCEGKRPALAPVITAYPRSIKAVKGRGRARSRRAAALTFEDALLHLAALSRVGGLRGGFATQRKGVVRLSRYALLRGVRVSGRVRVKGKKFSGTLSVSGGGATPARVKLR